MGVPRTNTCQQKVRNWIDKQSWWWRLQNCCTTLLPKLCCDRRLSLEKTLQLRSLWSLGKAKRTWDEKVVKVSNGAGKVFRQKNHFQKCVFVMRVIWGLQYWVNHASHKTLSNLLQASNQWQVYSSTDFDIVIAEVIPWFQPVKTLAKILIIIDLFV